MIFQGTFLQDSRFLVVLRSGKSGEPAGAPQEQEAAGCQWFTPAIPATKEAEIRRIMVQSQPGQIVCETLP
jgi:hypothetical protein